MQYVLADGVIRLDPRSTHGAGVAWAPLAFLERGGEGGQDRARGRHLTAAYTLSAFGQRIRGGGRVLSTFGQFNQWEGGGGG